MLPVLRALLFMPGDDRRKIEKGAALDVDAVIMDIEDGVALNQKPAARETIHAALQEVDFGSTERLVRVNPVSSVFHVDDLAATVEGQPDGYVIPKVESAEQVRSVVDWLSAHGGKDIPLLAIVESARGVVNLREIAACEGLAVLMFGAEDFAADIGAIRTDEGYEGFYARSAVVTHAKAYGLQAIDSPFVRLDDEAALVAETQRALTMGYTGKLTIHPKQVVPVQAVFTPTGDEIARAQRLIAAHEAQQAAGTGAFQLDGKMIDMPIVRHAETVIARAKAAGLLNDKSS
jgi:citrate lyase beta subunit